MKTETLPSLQLMTAEVVTAYVRANQVRAADLPGLITTVWGALQQVGTVSPKPAQAEPAVPIRKSIAPDYIVCLEDGKKLKMLKRYLMTSYGMTPDKYRERWGLPADYPMVAPNYAKRRSQLAKESGLGRGGRRR